MVSQCSYSYRSIAGLLKFRLSRSASNSYCSEKLTHGLFEDTARSMTQPAIGIAVNLPVAGGHCPADQTPTKPEREHHSRSAIELAELAEIVLRTRACPSM